MKILEKLQSVFQSLRAKRAGTPGKLLRAIAQNKVVLYALAGLALLALVLLTS